MIVLFCLRSLINKSVSSLDTHAVPAPGPISSLKIYGSDSSTVFFVKIFEVSAFALKRSKTEFILENFVLLAKLLLLIWDGSIFAVNIVSTSFCVSNNATIFSIVEGG